MKGHVLASILFALAAYGALSHFDASKDPATPSISGPATPPPAQNPSIFQRLESEPLSPADCEAWLGKSTVAEISAQLDSLDGPFWLESPNATILLDAAFARIAVERGAFPSALQAIEFVRSVRVRETARGPFLEAALSGAFRSGVPDSAAMASLLQTAGQSGAAHVLAAWFSAVPSSGTKPLGALATELWRTASLPTDKSALARLSRDLAPAVALRGNVREAFDAVGHAEYSEQRRAAFAGVARVLRKTNFEDFQVFVGLVAALEEPGRDRRAAAEVCFDCRLDYAKFPAVAQSLPTDFQAYFWEQFCWALRDENPGEAAELAAVVPPWKVPEDARPVLCGDLCAAGAGLVATWFREISPPERAAILDHATNYLRTPFAGRAWLELRARLPGITKDNLMMPFYTAGVAYEDRTAMLSIAEAFPPGPRNEAIEWLFDESPETMTNLRDHRGEEFARIAALPAEVRGKVFRDVLDKLASFDPRAALKEADAVPDRAVAIGVLNHLLAGNSPDFTLEQRKNLLLERLASAETPDGYALGAAALAKQYAYTDPDAGALLCSALPPGPLADSAIGALAEIWCAGDADSAGAWIDTLPDGSARDLAMRTLTDNLLDDPESALENAESIDDPTLRLQAAADVFRSWRFADLDEIGDFASDAGFTEDEISDLTTAASQPVTNTPTPSP